MARSDHKHALGNPGAPANVSKAAASAGTSANVARQDHKHDINTAAAVTLAAANAEGTASTMARSDHTHDHGAQTVETQHALAVAGVSHGFMSKTDKTNLDALSAGSGSIQTWGADSIAAAADTRFLPPGMIDGVAGTAALGFQAPRAGTYKNIRVRHNTANGDGDSVVYTLRKNGVATAVTVTLATGAIGSASNTTNSVAFAANDLVEMVATKALSITAGTLSVVVSAEFGP